MSPVYSCDCSPGRLARCGYCRQRAIHSETLRDGPGWQPLYCIPVVALPNSCKFTNLKQTYIPYNSGVPRTVWVSWLKSQHGSFLKARAENLFPCLDSRGHISILRATKVCFFLPLYAYPSALLLAFNGPFQLDSQITVQF